MTTLETYPITVGNVTRHVPLVETLPGMRIPLVEFLGDTELVEEAARLLAEKVPEEAELLFSLECSPVPLVHRLAQMTELPYVIARKRRRAYMEDPLIQEVPSLTLGASDTLWLDRRWAERIMNRKVALVMDVVSSGGTMKALDRLVQRAGGSVVGRLAVFQQGKREFNGEVTYLYEIPIL